MTAAKATYTAGPWEVISEYNTVEVSADGVPVCTLDGPVSDNRANGFLIAAAPDLLDLAKEVEDYLSSIAIESEISAADECGNICDDLCGHKHCDTNGCIKFRIRLARAAIAKATGVA